MNSEPPPQPSSRQLLQKSLTLEPDNARHLAELCGHLDSHLHQIEQRLGVRISARGNQLRLSGPAVNVATAERLLLHLYAEVCQGVTLTPETLHLHLQQAGLEHLVELGEAEGVQPLQISRTKRATIKPPPATRPRRHRPRRRPQP